MEKLTAKEQGLLLEILNGAIAYRLNNNTRKSDVFPIKEIKRKLNVNNESIREAYRDERHEREREENAARKATAKAKRKKKRDDANEK